MESNGPIYIYRYRYIGDYAEFIELVIIHLALSSTTRNVTYGSWNYTPSLIWWLVHVKGIVLLKDMNVHWTI